MSDKKYSEFSSGTPALSTDTLLVARTTDNFRLTMTEVNPDFALASVKPMLQRVNLDLDETAVRTLFSSPQTLVTAQSGVACVPEFFSYVREAGSAYTMGSAGNLQVLINSVAYDSFAVSSLLNGAGPYRRLTVDINGGASPYGAFGVATSTRDDTNKAMTLKITGGDVSGGSGHLKVTVFYRAWPLTQFA